jgi:hypothetical protein
MGVSISERILYCILASNVACMATLLVVGDRPIGPFPSEAVWWGSACLVFCVLLFVFVAPLVYLRLLMACRSSGEKNALVRLDYGDEAWRKPTTVGHLEELKKELRTIEQHAMSLSVCELEVERRRRDDPRRVEVWLGERGLAIARRHDYKERIRAAALRADIERIYSGDIDHELLDYQEELAKLTPNIGQAFGIEKAIRRCRRRITELEQWRAKAVARQTPCSVTEANEVAWQKFVDGVRRTAAVPIIEASSRVEAAFASIEVKRQYELALTDLWRRGRLSDEEAAFIRRRIHDEFLGGRSSIYV